MQNYYEKIVRRVWRAADYIRVALIIAGTLILVAAAIISAGILARYGLSMLVPIISVGAVVRLSRPFHAVVVAVVQGTEPAHSYDSCCKVVMVRTHQF